MVNFCFLSYIRIQLFIDFICLLFYTGIYSSDVFNYIIQIWYQDLGRLNSWNICPKFPNTYETDLSIVSRILGLCILPFGITTLAKQQAPFCRSRWIWMLQTVLHLLLKTTTQSPLCSLAALQSLPAQPLTFLSVSISFFLFILIFLIFKKFY